MSVRKTISILILLCAVSITARAGLMIIPFDEMISKCSKIVIGKYIDSDEPRFNFRIQVETVLKGKTGEKIISVGRATGSPDVAKGKRFIAFINETNGWEWVGTADSLETDIISMFGFYDFDGYLVNPSGITLVQLKQFITEKKFDGFMEGNLEFFNYQTAKKTKTGISFAVNYTYFSNEKIVEKVSWKNLDLHDFKSKPKTGIFGGGCRIEFEENMVRPLSFAGFIDSVHSDGKSFHARFMVAEPRDLDYDSFYSYLAHPEYGLPGFELEFALSDSTKYYFDMVAESGNSEYLIYNNKQIPVQECGQSTRNNKGGFKFGELGGETEVEIVLDFLPEEKRFNDFLYDSGSLLFIPSLQTAPWRGEFFVRENGKMKSKGRCTVRLKRIYFTKNENYKK
jgi:hypothetical protein